MVTIHEKTTQNFNTLGLGALLPSSCVVTEELNGSYELELTHPRDEEGKWKRIEEERILYASTPRGKQPFRIYRIKPTMSGITVNAKHIFYDLLDNQCEAVSFNGAASDALAALQEAFAYEMPFSFDTDITLSGTLATGRMNPIQALLSDDDETTSFVKGFGGELLRDGFHVSLKAAVGLDRDVAIRYGKNLIGLEVLQDASDVKTRIICYGSNGTAVVDSPYIGNYVYPKIHMLEDDGKKVAELKKEAQDLLDGGCDLPSVNIKVDFVALTKTVEYKDYAVLEEVFLGDLVTVIHTKMNFRKKAKVISYEWDCLLEQYNEVELGDFIPTLASSVTSGVKSGYLASAAAVTSSAVVAMLQAHMQDKNNPHGVTASQTGGSAGTDAGALLEMLAEHEENRDNPHEVTLTQVGFTSGTDAPDDANGKDGDVYLQTENNEEYTVLEYIESTGTQCIDLGFNPNENTKIEIELAFLGSAGTNIAGVRNSTADTTNRFGLITFGSASKIGAFFGSTAIQAIPFDSEFHKYSLSKAGFYVDSVLYTFSNNERFSCKYSFTLGAWNEGSNGIVCNASKIAPCQVYDNGIMVADVIPVLDANGVACMYDRANKVYHYNAGTGEFTAGPEVDQTSGTGSLWLKQNGTWIQVLKGAV